MHSPVHHFPVREQESKLQGHDSCSLKGFALKCPMLWSADGLDHGWNGILSVNKTIWQFWQYLLELTPFLDSKENKERSNSLFLPHQGNNNVFMTANKGNAEQGKADAQCYVGFGMWTKALVHTSGQERNMGLAYGLEPWSTDYDIYGYMVISIWQKWDNLKGVSWWYQN